MFKWFRRGNAMPAPPERKPACAQQRPASASAADFPPTGPPLPEVVSEGNTQADWSAWEDSMAALDSQLHEALPSTRIYVHDTRPSQLDEPDAFSGVRKHRDV